MKDTVFSPCQGYLTWMEDSELPRTLLQGTKGMKEAGETFLPKAELESDKSFKRRLEASTLLNAYKKTCNFLAGQVFQADIVFSEEVSEDFVNYSKDIDGKGNSLNLFAKRLFVNGIGKGVAHILIDVPKTGGIIKTQAEELAAGIRPYFRELRAEDVIGYRFDENGKLDQIRISESATKLYGKYSQEVTDCIRVYNQDGSWELHEKAKTGEWVIIDQGVLSFKGIPIASFIPGEEFSIMSGRTPLMDLAELNLYHWRSSSDQTNILHVGRVPLLFGRNVDLSQLVASSAAMITSDEDNSDMKYVEITGAAITAGRQDIKDCEASMAIYGLQQLVPRTGNMTATEKAITSAESHSNLNTWAIEFDSCLQHAFKIAGQFINYEFPDEGLEVNKEYNLGIPNAEELNALLKAHDQGILSAQAVFTEFRKRGIIDEHLEWDEIEAEMDQVAQNSNNVNNLAGTFFGGQTGEQTEE